MLLLDMAIMGKSWSI